jgi:hypothetical protein
MSSNVNKLTASQGFWPWLGRLAFAGILASALLPANSTWAQPTELVGPKNDSAATSALLTSVSSRAIGMTSVSTAPELNLPQSVAQEPAVTILPLGAREIGCQAALRWQPAIGLKQRAQTIQRLYCEEDQCKRQAANGLAQFLCLQASHQEDLAAATAMRAYYSRIGIDEQKKLIARGKQAVSAQLSKQNKLIDQGLAAGVDLSSLERQNFDLEDQLLQAESQDDQLRRLLTGMTEIDYKVEHKILEPLVVEKQTLDCDALVAMALRNRFDLQSWRCLYRQINDESAEMFASIIATSVGSFGIPLPKMVGLKLLMCKSYDKALLADNLRKEVATIIVTNEGYAQQLVVEKCSQLKLAYGRHELQLQRITSWEYRLKQIERLESHGDARPAERAAAETGLLKAHSDEVARRLDAKLAEVSLAEVIGGLAGKCCRGEAWFPQP